MYYQIICVKSTSGCFKCCYDPDFLFQLPCAGPELLSCLSGTSVLTSAVAAVPSSFPKGRHLESTEETSTMRKTVRTNSSRLACYHSKNKDTLSSTSLAFNFQMASLGQVRNLEANSRSMAALSSASQKIASQQHCMPKTRTIAFPMNLKCDSEHTCHNSGR